MLSNIIKMASGAWKTVADAKTTFIVGGMIFVTIIAWFEWNNHNQRQIGATGEKVKNLEGQIHERNENDKKINDAKKAGRTAASGNVECMYDPFCRK